MHTSCEYISAGCSRTPHSLDWGPDGRICYCSGQALLLAKQAQAENTGFQVTHTAHKHTNDVITCRWIRRLRHGSCVNGGAATSAATSDDVTPATGHDLTAAPLIITGSRDCSAIVWCCPLDTAPCAAAVLSGHACAVELADGAVWGTSAAETQRIMCVTAASDGTIRLWSGNSPSEVAHQQTVSLGRALVLSLRVTLPPRAAAPWVLYGTDDSCVGILTADASGVYSPSLRLSGHSDWIRCIDDVTSGSQLLVATGGQDATVRVWRISSGESTGGEQSGGSEEVTDGGEVGKSIVRGAGDGSGDGVATDDNTNKSDVIASAELRLRSQTLTTLSTCCRPLSFSVMLDSVLSGHEGWVYGVGWRPGASPPELASASMDRSLLIWAGVEGGVYVETARLGAVGGNTLGLLGCAWRPDGGAVIAHGHTGAVHVWRHESGPGSTTTTGDSCHSDTDAEPDHTSATDNTGASEDTHYWRPGVPFGGHASSVVDLAWAPSGAYLLTCGADQTTRLHAATTDGRWHQLGRPQVHGHDMACVATVTDTVFASGSEEKVARAFSMPSAVRDTLAQLCGTKIAAGDLGSGSVPEGAAVPSLGLTNKAVFPGAAQTAVPRGRDQAAEAYFQRPHLTAPPTEETLLQNTLWPEMRKLYGHGYELFAMAASHDGRVLATACKAARPEHTAILLWDTASWRQVGQLAGAHQLTVVQLAFSPDDVHLLAVSRDRTWSLWCRSDVLSPADEKSTSVSDGAADPTASTPADNAAHRSYRLLQRGVKAHARIIWCCAWLPRGGAFVTGSRDGCLQMWRRSSEGDTWNRHGQPYRPGGAVTAVAVSGRSDITAVGLESGEVRLVAWSEERGWMERTTIDTSAAHHGAVKRLQFRPASVDGSNVLLLASCAADGAVKLHRICDH